MSNEGMTVRIGTHAPVRKSAERGAVYGGQSGGAEAVGPGFWDQALVPAPRLEHRELLISERFLANPF